MNISVSKNSPNLVYVFADQLRYQSCGYAGDQNARTPNIDKLATESVNLCNAISGHPVCAPYRASLFTGKYTTSTGMVINEIRMNTNHHCLAQVLQENGYDTAYIGKWHLWANELGNHYDLKNSYTPPGPDRLGFDGYWAAYNFHHENYNMYYHTNSEEKIMIEGYEPDGQTDMTIDILRKKSQEGEPFALFLSIGTPHDPWVPENVPKEYWEIFKDVEFNLPPNYKPKNDSHADAWARLSEMERNSLTEWMKVYYAMTANLDWNVGRIMKAIEDFGLKDNTIFVFTSDHGEMFGAQGRRAKNIFYEEAVRVPFLLRWPNKIKKVSVSDICLNTCDIMPSLLSLMEIPTPAGVEGMDLSRCILGENAEEPEFAFLQGTGATAAWEDGHEWRALRNRKYTYAVYRCDGEELLFNNLEDPYQLNNLALDPSYEEILIKFRILLKDKMTSINDNFEASTWYRDNWVKDRIIIKTATLN